MSNVERGTYNLGRKDCEAGRKPAYVLVRRRNREWYETLDGATLGGLHAVADAIEYCEGYAAATAERLFRAWDQNP